VFVFDAGYDPVAISEGLKHERAQVLVRLRSDRVFYTDPPAGRRPGAGGRPRRHGQRFKLSDPKSEPRPTAQLRLADPRYGKVGVRAWAGLHPKLSGRGRWAGEGLPPIVRGTVIRVDVERLPKPSSRANNKVLWLWWSGPGKPDLELCLQAYLHRFDLEHTYRFAKNTLGWTRPSLKTPEQADRWTWLTAAAYTQLRLARGPRRRHAPALGAATRPSPAHPSTCAEGVSPTSCGNRYPPPTYRNPPRLALGARKALPDPQELVIRWSKRPLEPG
jgi:hypothetical protein